MSKECVGKVLNRVTNRCVKIDGKIGKAIIALEEKAKEEAKMRKKSQKDKTNRDIEKAKKYFLKAKKDYEKAKMDIEKANKKVAKTKEVVATQPKRKPQGSASFKGANSEHYITARSDESFNDDSFKSAKNNGTFKSAINNSIFKSATSNESKSGSFRDAVNTFKIAVNSFKSAVNTMKGSENTDIFKSAISDTTFKSALSDATFKSARSRDNKSFKSATSLESGKSDQTNASFKSPVIRENTRSIEIMAWLQDDYPQLSFSIGALQLLTRRSARDYITEVEMKEVILISGRNNLYKRKYIIDADDLKKVIVIVKRRTDAL